jgi:hypothetical protein
LPSVIFPIAAILELWSHVIKRIEQNSFWETLLVSVQGDSRGKINILGGNIIGCCENRSSYEHVSSSEGLPRWTCSSLL